MAMRRIRIFRATLAAVTTVFALEALPAYPSQDRVMVTALAIDPQTPTTVYAGTYGGGVFKTTDGGTSWSPTGLANVIVSAMAINPQSPTILYVATKSGGVLKSMDGGVNWNVISQGWQGGPCNPCGGVLTLAIDPLIPATFFGGADE